MLTPRHHVHAIIYLQPKISILFLVTLCFTVVPITALSETPVSSVKQKFVALCSIDYGPSAHLTLVYIQVAGKKN